MKDLAYYQENWDYRHFLAYAYIAVANSDYEITEEDLNEIHNKLAPSIFNEKEYQEMYHEVLKVYNKQNDNEVFQFLESLCEKHISSEDQKQKLLKDIQDRDNNIYRLYFEVNPIPEEQRKAGFGGVNRYKALEGFDNSEMIIDVTKNMDILSKQLYVQSKSLDEIVKLAENREELLAAIPAIQPVKKENLTRMASVLAGVMTLLQKQGKDIGEWTLRRPREHLCTLQAMGW